jgi:RHS repeat-associated protein
MISQWYNSRMYAIMPRDAGPYSYAETGYANPHAVTSVGGTTYTYDNNGNVTAIGSLDYTWDWRNRLASAERSGGGITAYGYDHTGQRVFKATGTATTSYHSRYFNLATTTGAATTTKHIFSPDGTLLATVVGASTTPSTTYLHPDHLGGTNVTTDGDGEVTQTLDYYPYGSQRIASGSFSEQRRFIGEEYDPDTAFSYLNARYYEGSRGQFMSQDPLFVNLGMDKRAKQVLIDPQQLNSYGYARGNPITLKDPSGELAFLAIPASAPILQWVTIGLTGIGLVKTVESFYSNILLPRQYPTAFTQEQKEQAPFRFAAEATLNLGPNTIGPAGTRLASDLFLTGLDYVPNDAVAKEGEEQAGANKKPTFRSINPSIFQPNWGLFNTSNTSQSASSPTGGRGGGTISIPGTNIPRSRDPVGQDKSGASIYCWGAC